MHPGLSTLPVRKPLRFWWATGQTHRHARDGFLQSVTVTVLDHAYASGLDQTVLKVINVGTAPL